MVTTREHALRVIRASLKLSQEERLVERIESAIRLFGREPLRIRVYLENESTAVIRAIAKEYEDAGWTVVQEPVPGKVDVQSLLLF